MSNFVQAKEYDVHIYTKFGHLCIYRFLQLTTSRHELLKFSTRKSYSKQDLVRPNA
jgi:hypothetical protein